MSEQRTQIAIPRSWNITPEEVDDATGRVANHFPELTGQEKGVVVMLRLMHVAYSKRAVTLDQVAKAITEAAKSIDQSKLNDKQRMVLQGHWLTLPGDPNQIDLAE